ncbi:MAG: 5'/3'-nucleotidase SurE [Acidiferrobacteraceae bacterium]|nr:5'/3'-nucleotidase SurE [Acidiferrobacteraceae bacterium]|tara:strand:- start:15048 stop:15815 length:768 start_codon:yes stop_codon:yes gene_type:complete
MKILISNDDGYFAPGIACLANKIQQNNEVTVVAPDRNRSGASNAITLHNPLRIRRAENGFFFVDGTPADCVQIGITGIMKTEPDIVISGINAGANLGDDVLYSGTVGAAMEGRFLRMPAIAVSLAPNKENNYEAVNFETAAIATSYILEQLKRNPLPADMIINVNVPDLAWSSIDGFELTRLGDRGRPAPVIKQDDPYGRELVWIGGTGPEEDAGPGTDFYAIKNSKVSLTPLKTDLTKSIDSNQIEEWLNHLVV